MSTPTNDNLAVHPAGRPGIPVRDEPLEPPKDDSLTRRTALKLASATALFASGAVGCRRKPMRHIVSVHDMPEYQRPGEPLYYASTFTEGPYPYGMMVKTVDGRPIKIEGLPGHPLNDGTSDAWMQGAMLSLYDPERLRAPMRGDGEITWEKADADVVAALRSASRVVLVTRANLGPSERALVKTFGQALAGKLVHHVHEPAGDGPRRAAWKHVTGRDGAFVADLSKASVVLSIECDFLGTDGASLSATGQFASRRKIEGDASGLSRLYVAEGPVTSTGANADHRIPLRSGYALDLARALLDAKSGDKQALAAFAKKAHVELKTLEALAADLGPGSVVLAGAHLPPPVHAAVLALNAQLGALGDTLRFEPDAPLAPSAPSAIRADVEGADVVICLGVNPVYDAPSLAPALRGVETVVGHGLTRNETLAAATYALPSAHNLESWNDAAPTAGVQALCQPQIEPLFDGRQEAASLFVWTTALDAAPGGAADWHEYLRARWEAALPADTTWEQALRRGWVGEPRPAELPPVRTDRAAALMKGPSAAATEGGFDLVLLPHSSTYDGRYAGNAWLQELPAPVTKLVWDAAAALHPDTAAGLGVKEGDWIRVTAGETSESLPVLVQPGMARDVVAMTLGYGRTAGAGVGNGVGTNAAPLQNPGAAPRFSAGVKVEKDSSRGHYALVRTQDTFSQHDRPIALSGTAEEYREDPAFVKHRQHVPPLKQLDEPWDYSKGRKWAMAIDLSACTGCNACVVACQSENNIAVVGKDECAKTRDMQWMRIDTYHDGDPDDPTFTHQPMLCQHCDNAPCENVCPVNATAHSPEGLNEQAYNRCVGTRYCSNNCPYKVRHFNYLAYSKHDITDPIQELHYNPQVTVRSRGIMEKCTFCVQRINAVKFDADNEGRPIRDGELKTACQQACPASAIVFGNVNDEESKVAASRENDLAYHVLEELNVRPNVTYLAKVRNPNPALASPRVVGAHEAGGHG